MGEQEARRGPSLVAWILVDDGIERAANQETPRVLGQLMGNPDHLARAPGGLQRIGDATVPGAAAVYAAQIGMAREQRSGELPRALAVVAASMTGSARRFGYSLDRIWWKPNCRSV